MYMKKTNKILAGCLALLLALTVGYALFSETITINGIAQAKGSFDIEMTCTKGVPDNVKDALDAALNYDGILLSNQGYPEVEGGYSNDECTISGNTITYSANLNYPGALRYFIVKATNNGTIKAKLDSDQDIYGGNQIKNETCIYNSSDNSLDSCNNTYLLTKDTLSGFRFLIAKESTSGKLYTWEKEEIWDALSEDNYFFVEPNESLYFVYGLSWNKNWTDKTKYLTFEGTFELPFAQYTN